MDMNNLKCCVDHEEATIQSFVRDPDFADFYLKDIIADGNIHEIRRAKRRVEEAKARRAQLERIAEA